MDRALYPHVNVGVEALTIAKRALYPHVNVGVEALAISKRALYFYGNVLLAQRALYAYANISGIKGFYVYANIYQLLARGLYVYADVQDVPTGYTLGQASYDLARLLTEVYESNMESGDGDTVTDTWLQAAPGEYTGGTLWLFTPLTYSALITGNDTGSLAYRENAPYNVPYPPGSGYRYAVCGPEYPRWLLRQSINAALLEAGPLPDTDEFDATANTNEYTLDYQAGLPGNVIAIEMAEYSGGVLGGWTPHYRWRMMQGSSGAGPILTFDPGTAPRGPGSDTEGWRVRYTFTEQHELLTQDWEVISAYLNRAWVIWKAAVHALLWKLEQDDRKAETALEYPDEKTKYTESGNRFTPLRQRLAEARAMVKATAKIQEPGIPRKPTVRVGRW